MLKPKLGEVRKPTRTISGITPVAVMLPPRKCEHGACVYCPSLNVPQSYTPKSPVVLRAAEVNYDSYKQVVARLKAFEAMNHPVDKVELIIMGGTFLEYGSKFQNEFVKGLYEGLNGRRSKDLQSAQKKNEKSKHRCVALCIETRPDRCSGADIKKMRGWGATRVELGVQIIDDVIYKKINRGHKVQDVVDATKRLRDVGFKIGYHMMPGLPGSSFEKDFNLFKKIFSDERFKPDQLKIYPCQVVCGADLEKAYWKKKYKPYTREETEKLLIKMFKVIPRYCRVMRVMREIPPEFLVAGTIRIDLRKDIEEELRAKKIKLDEIRFREVGFNKIDNGGENELMLKITKYRASEGEEYFLEIVDKNDILFGLLRLRIVDLPPRRPAQKLGSSKDPQLITSKSSSTDFSDKNIVNVKNFGDLVNGDLKNLERSEGGERAKRAIIRELHVYGKSLKLGQRGVLGQHLGLGKWLMSEAEKIVREKGIKKLSVISGVGVREYYKKLGYVFGKGWERLMVKKLN